MLLEAFLFILMGGLLYFLAVHRRKRSKNFPPGPRPLPLIGNVFDMTNFNHMTMRALAKQYGGIYMLTVMSKKIFVVADIDLAWDALVRQGNIFAGRTVSSVVFSLNQGLEGFVMGDFGSRWKLLRKVTHSALRIFGSGIRNLESKIYREVDELCFQLSQAQGVPMDPRRLLRLGAINVISSCLFSSRYAKGDKRLDELIEMVDGTMYVVGSSRMLETFPFMRFFPGETRTRLQRTISLREKLLSSTFHERKRTYEEGIIRDITDALIKALHDVNNEDSNTKGMLSDQYLKLAICELFTAGMDTTSSFLIWSFLYLAAFPDVQAEIHQQLDDVIGHDRRIRFEDRSSLPYLEATLSEIMRHSSFAFFTVPHRVRSDTTLGSYEIPENSQVIFDLRAIHHDPKHWKDPDLFDPKRFLDPKDGSFICPATFSFLPFGAGPRGCIGQMLARIEVFLFVGHVLQQFSLNWPPDFPNPDLEPPVKTMRGVLEPKFFKLYVAKRK